MAGEQVERIKGIFSGLFDELNRMGSEQNVTDALKETLGQQHRTLQQNFFRYVIVPAIQTFAEKLDRNLWDLRNEASCKLASKLQPMVKDVCLPFI